MDFNRKCLSIKDAIKLDILLAVICILLSIVVSKQATIIKEQNSKLKLYEIQIEFLQEETKVTNDNNQRMLPYSICKNTTYRRQHEENKKLI